MEPTERQDVIVDICRDCGGVWLDPGELEQLAGGESVSTERTGDSDSVARPGGEPRDGRRQADSGSSLGQLVQGIVSDSRNTRRRDHDDREHHHAHEEEGGRSGRGGRRRRRGGDEDE